MTTENKKMLNTAVTVGVVLLLFAALRWAATFAGNIHAIFACEIVMWVAILVLVDIISGYIAMTIGRKGAYFWWGFFLGPVGVMFVFFLESMNVLRSIESKLQNVDRHNCEGLNWFSNNLPILFENSTKKGN